MPKGYCKKHECYLTSKDIENNGCKSRKKQQKFGRKVCKHLRVFAREKKVEVM